MTDEREEATDDGPIVTNAASPKQVEGARKRVRNRAREKRDDMRAILAMPEGRRFLWRLLGQCKVYESVFDREATVMAFRSGAQDVGHFVLAEIVEAQPDAYLQMMIEHHQETTHA